MYKVKIIRVESGTSKKNGKPFFIAWYFLPSGLVCRDFCPDWVKKDMEVEIQLVPSMNLSARIEFVKP